MANKSKHKHQKSFTHSWTFFSPSTKPKGMWEFVFQNKITSLKPGALESSKGTGTLAVWNPALTPHLSWSQRGLWMHLVLIRIKQETASREATSQILFTVSFMLRVHRRKIITLKSITDFPVEKHHLVMLFTQKKKGEIDNLVNIDRVEYHKINHNAFWLLRKVDFS